jgi:hypothetical protein
MTAPDTTPTRPDGASETLGDAASSPAPLTAEQLEAQRANANRYEFLRRMILRAPVKVNAWGQPTYGVVFEVPHDLNAGEFDRMLDALATVDDGTSTTIGVNAERVTGAAVVS